MMTTAAATNKWDIGQVQAHLQFAVELEFWTIPYYLAVLCSIEDPSCRAYRLIQSVVRQEMLHTQLASNLANAFGQAPVFRAPVFAGTLPHIDFKLDTPNPTTLFSPHSTAIGPLDQQRLNTMCLIEYPLWDTGRTPNVQSDQTKYGSLGEFYAAVRIGVAECYQELRANRCQVDFFADYYNDLPATAITKQGSAGLEQAMTLIDAIVGQGEGQSEGDSVVLPQFRNTADGFEESWPHFRKFMFIRELAQLPTVLEGKPEPATAKGRAAQQVLRRDFAAFVKMLNTMFRGEQATEFGALMAKLGGDVLNCWRQGATPTFS